MKMVVYSRQKTEKQQQAWLLMELKPDYYAIYSGKTLCRIGIGWSTHLSRSRQNLVKNRFLEALQCKFEQKSHMVCGSWLKFLNHQLFSSILDSHQICPKILAESRSEMKGHHQEYEKCDSPCVDSWAFNCFRDLTIATTNL
ncbi:hypothetical protein NC653_017856 [Populus alba x Populus x berolinensis]|uniref:Uncharacterized protein n=1 Tax=Populus alba x Populus x berolinensis TaxID=444605 RepID=A0AAD6QR96_9ROSI|nr:hypothetical protein NC653_017856 [Populus alba x Populus x berolinensis]